MQILDLRLGNVFPNILITLRIFLSFKKAQSSDCYLRLFLSGQSTLPWTYTTGAGYAAKDILDSGRQVQCVYITLGLRDGRVRPCYRLIYPRHIDGAFARERIRSKPGTTPRQA